MARVRFLADFDYRPTRRLMVAYPAGWEGTVRRECHDLAVAAGKAVSLDPDPAAPAPAAEEEAPP